MSACSPGGSDPTQPRRCGAGNGLTLICSWWEPHCSGTVYCIRGMLSSNQLSGRPSPDLIPTLAGLCACPVLTGELAEQDPTALSLAKSLPLEVPLSRVGQEQPSPGREDWTVARDIWPLFLRESQAAQEEAEVAGVDMNLWQ